jgi:hypothetical protein
MAKDHCVGHLSLILPSWVFQVLFASDLQHGHLLDEILLDL